MAGCRADAKRERVRLNPSGFKKKKKGTREEKKIIILLHEERKDVHWTVCLFVTSAHGKCSCHGRLQEEADGCVTGRIEPAVACF